MRLKTIRPRTVLIPVAFANVPSSPLLPPPLFLPHLFQSDPVRYRPSAAKLPTTPTTKVSTLAL